MYRIVFRWDNGEETAANVPSGATLLEAARGAGIYMDAPCAGNGTCGKCRVILEKGAVSAERSRHLTDDEWSNGIRLACESRVCGDAEILVPDTASDFKNGIRTAGLSSPEEIKIFEDAKKALEAVGILTGNGFKLISVSLEEPTLEDTMPDSERLIRAIKRESGTEKVHLTSVCLRKLARFLRENDFKADAAVVKDGDETVVYDLFPQQGKDRILGAAVDVGTTTVSAVLADMLTGEVLAKGSAGNSQIQYGADVINRIIASCLPAGSERLQKAVVEETVKPMIASMCESISQPTERIMRMTVAGNTTMNHLFTGVYADPVRMEPYIPSFFETDAFYGSDFNLGIHKSAKVVFAPNVGSYVGGDITAGTLVSMIWSRPEFSLFIDLGTNGELVFGNEDFLMSCACSAGPAFEGGEISCGMRATDGAVEACMINTETMEPEITVVGGAVPVGICGSGIIDTVSELFRCGIINAKGSFARQGKRILRDDSGIGRYIIAFGDENSREVSINEVDIANFIRAKGAIFSAVRTMLSSLDMDESVLSDVYVAGGIGSGINIKNAIRIGMLPDIPEECYHYVGNTSLTGAYSMLVSCQAEEKVRGLGRNMTYLELSAEPEYMNEFIAACFLPHTDAKLFPSAAK